MRYRCAGAVNIKLSFLLFIIKIMNIFTDSKYKEESRIVSWSKIFYSDILIYIPVFILCIIGVMLVRSATIESPMFCIKQIGYMIFFAAFSLAVSAVNIKTIFKYSFHAYTVSFLLLLFVDFKGMAAMGAVRWIDLKIFKLQPSEVFKIVLILYLSRIYYSDKIKQKSNNVSLSRALVAILVPVALIARQPDLATSVICIAIGLSVCFLAGLSQKIIVFFMISCSLSMPILWSVMHDYQKERVLNFVSPERDPLGTGYNIIQSKIAIGSGGFFGKGLGNGSQSQLDFLPERHTDFIFTVMCEEMGFITACIAILCYLAIAVRAMFIAMLCSSLFTKLIAGGCGVYFIVNAFVNIFMTIGLLPVAGVPLSFVSYGGSSVAAGFICIGLINNAYINCKQNKIS